MKISSPRVLRCLCAALLIFVAIASTFAQPTATWMQLTTKNSPSPRLAPAMAYDPISKRIVLFGGYVGFGYSNETWLFNGTNWRRIKTPVAPAGRAAAGIAFDLTLQKLVLFGGWDGHNYLGDTWIFDGATLTWTPTTPAKSPQPMTGPMVFTDPLKGRVDTYGGWDGRFYSFTTWRWRDGTWRKQFPKQFPSARSVGVVGTNPVLKQTVVFGGLADVNPVNTWTYDGHNWTQQFPATQLPYRSFPGTTYDPRFAGVITFGGFTGADNNDLWLWTGSDWQQLNPTAVPPPRESMGMAFDEVHQQTVIFGGLDGNSLLGDTWVLQTN